MPGWDANAGPSNWPASGAAILSLSKLKRVMQRVASLYLPQLAVERLRRSDRSIKPPEHGAVSLEPRFAAPIDDNPGACSVPRGGGWRPGARWAGDTASSTRPSATDVDALPAHQRPTMREMGRRSEPAEQPFRAMPPDEGMPGRAPARSHPLSPAWQRPMILIERVGQKEVVTAARSEEHTSELQSLIRNPNAVLCLNKRKPKNIIR